MTAIFSQLLPRAKELPSLARRGKGFDFCHARAFAYRDQAVCGNRFYRLAQSTRPPDFQIG
jgi:hypothetical protein